MVDRELLRVFVARVGVAHDAHAGITREDPLDARGSFGCPVRDGHLHDPWPSVTVRRVVRREDGAARGRDPAAGLEVDVPFEDAVRVDEQSPQPRLRRQHLLRLVLRYHIPDSLSDLYYCKT